MRKLKVRIKEDAGCWIWIGSYTKYGVPYMDYAGVQRSVRQLILWSSNGKPNSKTAPLTTCGNIKCCNPEHVKAVSIAQKLKANVKNRNETLRKAKVSATMRARYGKLTDEDILEIRTSTEPAYKLAEEKGVHRSLVSRIRANQKHVVFGNVWSGLL